RTSRQREPSPSCASAIPHQLSFRWTTYVVAETGSSRTSERRGPLTRDGEDSPDGVGPGWATAISVAKEGAGCPCDEMPPASRLAVATRRAAANRTAGSAGAQGVSVFLMVATSSA